MGKKYILVFLVLLLVVSGCTPFDTFVNYNESSEFPLETHAITNYEPIRLQSGDILRIEVSSTDAEAVAVFREFQTGGYLISSDGTIDFPLVGKVELKDKSLEEARAALLAGVNKYFDVQPSLSVSLANFKVTVNGEISNPGVVSVQNDRITIIEAISQSGDFTAYSNRDSVMVVRENAEKRSFGYVNFNSSEIFKSPYFYLKQNDVIYIKPEKRFLGTVRTRQDKLLPYVSVAISVILLTITISRNR